MPRHKAPTPQPMRCPCNQKVDTPKWVGARRSGSGLGQNKAPAHGNPFAHRGGCSHSELSRTTVPAPARKKVKRLRIA